jgi:2-amino-4-hydroxy-6-hydroxymethyldihydropteridine diphosphokinase
MTLVALAPPRAVPAYVGLGANLGEARATLEQAVDRLARLPGTRWLRTSHWLASAPVEADGPEFVNGACLLETTLTAPALLAHLQAIERAFGRERPYRNAPRTLDLDLLLYGEARMDWPVLTLPHPRLHQRAFALKPLLDLDPDLVLPGLGPARAWLDRIDGQRVRWLD